MLFALTLSIAMLFYSQARAGILAAAGRVLPDLRGLAAIPADGSGRHGVFVRGGARHYGYAFRISGGHARAAGKFVSALDIAL